MKQPGSKWILLFSAAAVVAAFATQPAQAELLEKTKKMAGTTVSYKVVLPNGYDPAKPYPAILAFGGGPQTMNTVDGVLNRNFRAEAEKRGYICNRSSRAKRSVVLRGRGAHFPGVSKDDPGGLQDTRQ